MTKFCLIDIFGYKYNLLKSLTKKVMSLGSVLLKHLSLIRKENDDDATF